MTDLDTLTNLQKAMYEVNEKLYAVCHNGGMMGICTKQRQKQRRHIVEVANDGTR